MFLFSISWVDDFLVFVIMQYRSKGKFRVRGFCEKMIVECPWAKPLRERTYRQHFHKENWGEEEKVDTGPRRACGLSSNAYVMVSVAMSFCFANSFNWKYCWCLRKTMGGSHVSKERQIAMSCNSQWEGLRNPYRVFIIWWKPLLAENTRIIM